jgi:transposase
VKIYLLPGYSPELNPDEQVWLHVHNDLKGVIVANKKDLIQKVRQSLYRQQKQKSKVSSYFRHPDVQRKSD